MSVDECGCVWVSVDVCAGCCCFDFDCCCCCCCCCCYWVVQNEASPVLQQYLQEWVLVYKSVLQQFSKGSCHNPSCVCVPFPQSSTLAHSRLNSNERLCSRSCRVCSCRVILPLPAFCFQGSRKARRPPNGTSSQTGLPCLRHCKSVATAHHLWPTPLQQQESNNNNNNNNNSKKQLQTAHSSLTTELTQDNKDQLLPFCFLCLVLYTLRSRT